MPLREPEPRMYEYSGLGLDINGDMQQPPPSSTRRANLVKIVNEVLVFCSTRANTAFNNEWATPRVLDAFKRHVIRLFRLAATRADPTESQHSPFDVWHLYTVWTETQPLFFDADFRREVTMAYHKGKSTRHAQIVAENMADRIRLRQLFGPFKPYTNSDLHTRIYLPRRHSVKNCPDAPWHELPAGNGLYMASTRGHPLRAGAFPKGGYQLPLGGQEADPELAKDVRNLHQEMLFAFDEYADADEILDIDPLGNKVWKDPERPTRNYWGFSYHGLEMMKKNRKKFSEQVTGYADVPSVYAAHNAGAMDDVNAAVARARELAASRGFGDRGRGRGGRGGGGGWRGGHDRGRGGRGGRGGSRPW